VVSVTPDVSASASFQAASPRSPRFDPMQQSGNFAALVDANTPSESPSPPPPAPQRSQSTNPPSADHTPSPDTRSVDRSPPSNSADAPVNSGPSADAGAREPSTTTDGKDNAASSGDGKAANAKSGPGKSTDKSSTDGASAADSATGAQPNATAVTVQNATAVAIAVTVAPVDAPAVSQGSGDQAKPLAIAAAAIAATAALTAAGSPVVTGLVPSATQLKADAGTAATTNTTTTAKISAQAATIVAPAKPGTTAATTQANAATDATTDTPLATAIGGSAVKTAAPKTTTQGQKTSSTFTIDGAASPDSSKTGAVTDLAHNGAAPQPADVAKPDAALAAAVGAAKPDASGTAPANANTVLSSHDHASVATNEQPSPAGPDPSLQAPASFQPQAPATTPIISAANLTAAQATTAGVPLSGLAVEIAASAHSGKTRFDVRLDPADLGRIDVRIDVDRNGQVTSHLTVEKPETLSMLQQDAPQLRQALDDAGLKTGNGGLQFSLRDQSSSGQNNGDQTNGNAQRLVISEDDTVPAVVAGRSYGRMLGSNAGVDIRV
jgi:flagellar hook-length control protein FliK